MPAQDFVAVPFALVINRAVRPASNNGLAIVIQTLNPYGQVLAQMRRVPARTIGRKIVKEVH